MFNLFQNALCAIREHQEKSRKLLITSF